MSMWFNAELARESIRPLLLGLKVTVELTLATGAISLTAAVPVALMRMSRFRLVRLVVGAYVQIIRSTPLLIQLIYIYYALPLFGIRFGPMTAAVIGLSLHMIPYLAEAYRSGIQSVPQGQRDAATALGFTPYKTFVRIIFPQAFRIVIPVLGNFVVSLFKDTSLASILTVQELLYSGQIIGARTFDYFTMYTMVFIGYLIVGLPAIKAVDYVERRLSRPRRRNAGGQLATLVPSADLTELS